MIIENNQLIQFSFEESDFHTFIDDKGEPWISANHICKFLQLDNVSMALQKVDENDKMAVKNKVILNDFGSQSGKAPTYVNESGFYALVLGSRKQTDQVKRFKKKVTSEILPSIRKTGSYSIYNKPIIPTDPYDIAILATDAMKRERELRINAELKLQIAETKIEIDAENVAFAQTVSETQQTLAVKEFANLLGKDCGVIRFYKFLREKGIIQNSGDKDQCLPYQKYIDKGWFKIVEKSYVNIKGFVKLYFQTRVTGKGQKELAILWNLHKDDKNYSLL